MSTSPEQVHEGAAAPGTALAERTTATSMAALKPQPDGASEIAAGFNSLRAFELLQRAGKALAASTIVPETYRASLSNCVVALEMAQRIGASPLMVMQNLYIVYGRPAWSAKFLIACFNQCGRFSAIRYTWSGTPGKDDWGCQAWAIEKETGEKIFGPVITLQLAKDEGWYHRKDSKWKTMPEKMFMYRAAAWMVDTHAPEISMGIRTDDEIKDAFDATRGADGTYEVTTESLRHDVHATPAAEPAGRTDPPQPQGKPPESRTEEFEEQLRSRQAKDQQGGEQPDTAQRGEVMNPPGGAAEPPEAGNLSTPPSKGARASPPAKASGAQRAPAGAPAKKTAAAAGHGTAASRPTVSAAEPEPSGSPAAGAASGAEPAESGSTGDEDAIPHFDTETAIAAIKATTSLGQFKDITNQVADDFRDTDREIPDEVVAASEEHQAHICIGLIRAGTSLKKLNANYDRVVAAYGSNLPDVVVEAFKAQQAALERNDR